MRLEREFFGLPYLLSRETRKIQIVQIGNPKGRHDDYIVTLGLAQNLCLNRKNDNNNNNILNNGDSVIKPVMYF